MANTLHDNIVVQSKLKAPTENDDQLLLTKNGCGQAKCGLKSQAQSLASSGVPRVGIGTDILGISRTDARVAGKGPTKSTVLKNAILDAYQNRHGPENGQPIVTTKTGEPTKPSTTIPSISNLVTAPIMRPNNRRSY